MRVPLLDQLAADGFGHWFAGFMDGEGSLILWAAPSHNQSVKCRCQIEVRQDEMPVLLEIRNRLGLGSVGCLRPRRGNHPGARWIVAQHGELMRMVEVFDRFPLRAKKARDYAIWREAVLEWDRLRGAHGPGVRFDWTRMRELKDELAAVRQFSPLGARNLRDPASSHSLA